MNKFLSTSMTLLLLATCSVHAKPFAALSDENEVQTVIEPADRVELSTSVIKGNKELPQILYIVPWQEVKKVTKKPKDMVLHSLYGDIFHPVTSKESIE